MYTVSTVFYFHVHWSMPYCTWICCTVESNIIYCTSSDKVATQFTSWSTDLVWRSHIYTNMSSNDEMFYRIVIQATQPAWKLKNDSKWQLNLFVHVETNKIWILWVCDMLPVILWKYEMSTDNNQSLTGHLARSSTQRELVKNISAVVQLPCFSDEPHLW